MTEMTRTVSCAKAITLALLLVTLVGCAGRYSSFPPPSEPPAGYTLAEGATAHDTFETDDALTLFGQWWLPQSETPKGVVLLVHGTFIHSGFYAPWATFLSENGYAVFGVDMRGWGQSQGFGRRGFVRGHEQYVADLLLAHREIKKRFPDAPLYIQGESLGGVVALLTQDQRSENFLPADGLILNAAAVRVGPALGPVRQPYWSVRYFSWLLSFPADAFPNAPAWYHARLAEVGVDISMKDERVADRYKADPFVLHKALPLSYFTGMHRGGRKVHDALNSITTPVILLHGTKDNLVPLSSSEYVLERIGSANKSLKVYDGMGHATLHDIGRDKVWGDTLEWLARQGERIQAGRQQAQAR